MDYGSGSRIAEFITIRSQVSRSSFSVQNVNHENTEYQFAPSNGGGPSRLQSARLVAAVAELLSLACSHTSL
jgi:hypothetical protein